MSEPDPERQSKVPFAWLVDWWRREWRPTAVVLLVLVAVLLVVRVVLNVWIGHKVNDEVARLETIYGRLDPATLAPPRVPPGENRARVMRAAASLTIVGTAELAAQQWPIGSIHDPRRLVEENQLAIQVAEQGRRRPKSNWEIEYAQNGANFPRLLDVRHLGIVLSVSCRVDIEAGRADQAAEAALAGLAEAASLGQEPELLIQLIRMTVAKEQFRCLRDLLERAEPSAALLSEMAAALPENRTPDPIHTAFIGELKHANHMFAQMEGGNVGDYVGVRPSPAWGGPITWLCRPLIRYARLRYLQGMAHIMERQFVPPFARRPPDTTEPSRYQRPKWWQLARRFDETFLTGLTRADKSGYEYLSMLNAAELSVALRRFRLDRGRYPDALAELAPQYVAQVPIDPFTGRPPEYTRQGAGFELRAHGPKWVNVEDRRLLEWKITR